jgi:hypothetical protein
MKTNKKKFIGFSLLAVFALVLSACGSSSKEPTPTPVDPNLIAAQAIATFAMGLTQTAFAQPTATLTPAPLATNTLLATFAPLGTNTPSVPVNTCDSATFVNDVTVPDGTPMAPGQQFTKTWLVKNSGTCTWTPTYKIAYGYGMSQMGGAATPIGKTVKPGEQAEISVALTAPSTAGDVSGTWRLMNDKGVFFGTNLTVVIKVVGAAATGTATSEPTVAPATATATPETPVSTP